MKILNQLLFVIFSLILLSSNCKKDNQAPVSELSKLPAATQTGANTAGCLVNGVALLPEGSVFSGPHLQCNYEYLDNDGYYFTLMIVNTENNSVITQVLVETQAFAIAQGQTIVFKIEKNGNADALYDLTTSSGIENRYVTNSSVSGQLTITKLDQVKQIVSGTFYFNAINSNSDTVKVTDGRFDMIYTR